MKFGSVFTGIGGFDLGFENVGMRCEWQIEIDKYAQKVLQTRWPNVRRFEDVKKTESKQLSTVDAICGGFPCQDLSIAGRRSGLAGERSGLYFEFQRIIASVRPRWAIVENVPGLLSSNGGRDFAIVLAGLTGIVPGIPKGGWGNAGFAKGKPGLYNVAYRVFDAQFFGVAQGRRRVFIVASLGNGRSAQVLFERESLPGNIEKGRKKTAQITGAIDGKSASSDRGSQSNEVTFLVFGGGHEQNEKSLSLTAHSGRYDFETENLITGILAADYGKQGGNAFANMNNGTVPTIRANGVGTRNAPNGNESVLPISLSGVRRLMPVECERLQGFPDGWTDIGQSDSQRYKQLGNAVCVPVAEWIANRILPLDKS